MISAFEFGWGIYTTQADFAIRPFRINDVGEWGEYREWTSGKIGKRSG